MGLMAGFFLLACIGAATIAASLWDYRLSRRRKREWKDATSTTMVSGSTRHIIITYKED